MTRRNALHYILELIVVFGFLVLGITILTMLSQGSSIDRIVIGALVLSIGVIQIADYFTWKFAMRRRSIPAFVAAILSVVLGAVLMIIHNMDTKLMCYIWGPCIIAFALARIATAAVNMTYQPLINAVKIISAITEIVFSILLIIRTLDGIHPYMWFLGIALCVEAFVLFIEFIIHRYQRI